MNDSEAVRAIQTWYPQIYVACHTSHKRPGTTRSGISARDSSILAHLDDAGTLTVTALAKHLGIGAPTMSAAVKRLASRGYVSQDADREDARLRRLRITAAGMRAMEEASVLDSLRIRSVLRRLSPRERSAALRGLSLLARAARELMEGETA